MNKTIKIKKPEKETSEIEKPIKVRPVEEFAEKPEEKVKAGAEISVEKVEKKIESETKTEENGNKSVLTNGIENGKEESKVVDASESTDKADEVKETINLKSK